MEQVQFCESTEFGAIRMVDDNGKIMFCGKDVATALGYTNTVDALKTHCREDGVAFHDLTDSLGRTQQAKFIDEGKPLPPDRPQQTSDSGAVRAVGIRRGAARDPAERGVFDARGRPLRIQADHDRRLHGSGANRGELPE